MNCEKTQFSWTPCISVADTSRSRVAGTSAIDIWLTRSRSLAFSFIYSSLPQIRKLFCKRCSLIFTIWWLFCQKFVQLISFLSDAGFSLFVLFILSRFCCHTRFDGRVHEYAALVRRCPSMSDYALWIPAPNKRRREYARVCIYEVGREQGFPWKRNFRGFETSSVLFMYMYPTWMLLWERLRCLMFSEISVSALLGITWII